MTGDNMRCKSLTGAQQQVVQDGKEMKKKKKKEERNIYNRHKQRERLRKEQNNILFLSSVSLQQLNKGLNQSKPEPVLTVSCNTKKS